MLSGRSSKMRVSLGETIDYFLRLDDKEVPMNQFIGRKIQLRFLGNIHCVVCGRVTKKSFAQGFCYPCMQTAPENSECIIRPELCRGHLGEGRDVEWEQTHHVCEHVVYLAISSGFKVGVTRGDQVPTRWIDQGASQARVIARTPHRCAAGEMEVALKHAFSDRTSWQKMLKNEVLDDPDWDWAFDRVDEVLPLRYAGYVTEDEDVVELNYPVQRYPEKVKSLSFDKEASIEGTLLGIKGQYLLLDENRVLNIRKHNGYCLEFSG